MVAQSSRPGETKLGVASDHYFKPGEYLISDLTLSDTRPGPMTILPLHRLYIERQVQPEMLSFVSTEEVDNEEDGDHLDASLATLVNSSKMDDDTVYLQGRVEAPRSKKWASKAT